MNTPQQTIEALMAKGDIKLIWKPIDEVIENPGNPRFITDQQKVALKNSIQKFPEMLRLRPGVIDEDGVLLGGNQRKMCCKELGWELFPVIMASDLTPEQLREFIIKDNLGFGEWDFEILNAEWDKKLLDEWGFDVSQFPEPVKVAEQDEYFIPNEIKTDIVLGDLFDIGEHRLLCGDSTQIATFERLLGEEIIDMVVTDPPYNVDYNGNGKKGLTIENDKMSRGDFYKFLFEFFNAMGLFTRPGGPWYVWQSDKEANVFSNAFKASGFKFSSFVIWVKNALVMSRGDYHSRHETCIYGWKDGGAHQWHGDRKQDTVLEYDKPKKNDKHPTMKPVPLFAYQITNSSRAGEIVGDGFGGSGTTMVACEQLGRKARVVEISPKFCWVIIDRMLALKPEIIIKKNGKPYIHTPQ